MTSKREERTRRADVTEVIELDDAPADWRPDAIANNGRALVAGKPKSVENVATANKKPQRIDEGDEPDWPTKTKQRLADGRSIVNVTWFCENYGSRRIAKKLTQVSRWAAMERGLRECGIDEDEIERTMGELMGAFKESDTAGQQKWSTIRKAVVRRRSEADAFAHARKVEAEVVKKFVGDRRKTSPVVAGLIERRDHARVRPLRAQGPVGGRSTDA